MRPVSRNSRLSASASGSGGMRSTVSCVYVWIGRAGARVSSFGSSTGRDRADAVADDLAQHDHAAVGRCRDARARGRRSAAGSTARRSPPGAAAAPRRAGRSTGRSRPADLVAREPPRRIDLGELDVQVVWVSSMGTAQRMITGRLAVFSSVASSISRVNWWTFGGMKSQTRTHTRSPTRRVAM